MKPRFQIMAAYLLNGLGVTLLLTSILVAPQNAFAESGCVCSCGSSCDPSQGGDPNGTACQSCLNSCGSDIIAVNCCQYYCENASDPYSCSTQCCSTYCGSDMNCQALCSAGSCSGCTNTCTATTGYLRYFYLCSGGCGGTPVACPIPPCGCGPSSNAGINCGCWDDNGFGQ